MPMKQFILWSTLPRWVLKCTTSIMNERVANYHLIQYDLGGEGELPTYDIVRMCLRNSPLLQHCQVYDKTPFLRKSIWPTQFFIIVLWMVPFSDNPVWKYSYFCSDIRLRIRGPRSGINTIKHHTWPRIAMGKWQRHTRHHKREPRGQPFPSRWPQASTNRRAWKHNKTRQK